MVYPKLYLGHIPPTASERRALRRRALDLREHLHAARAPEPIYVLLSFSAGDHPPASEAELLLLRPNSVIVGAIREYRGAIEALPGGRWFYRDSGEPIRDRYDQPPLQLVKAQRDAVRDRLHAQAARLLDVPADAQPFARTVGALICSPSTHPDSRISLDVDEHRQLLKVLGLDELSGLAAMVRTGALLTEEQMRAIAADLFAGRLWHDGERFLFELAPARFQLRLLAEGGDTRAILPLVEGENSVGRRRDALRDEHRLTLAGDDLVSIDHAQLICGESDHVLLRDTSKNGTWVTPPDAPEERVHEGARVIVAGTLLRMGVTRMRLEGVDG